MRLVTFTQQGTTRLGGLRGTNEAARIVDLARVEPRLPSDMLALLRGGVEMRALAQNALDQARQSDEIPLADVTLQAPLPRPGKIICIGLNYRDHAAESNAKLPDVPTVFAKYDNCVIGHGAAIVIPRVTNQVDYEAELAFVIGRRARHIAEEDALDYVAGYTIFNDVSARDYQTRTTQWTIGKTFDTFGPMGPALVTADQVADPQALDLRLTIGGELLQSSNTRNMIFSIRYLIAYLSNVMTLEPGDLISTGTPAGVGMARQPPRFLRAGDVVQVEIQGLGILRNTVIAEM